MILLKKLYHAGIHGNLYRWFCSYIERRTQAVVLNGFISSWITTPSGVPQGSMLSPLLFAIFINDIGTCFHHSKIFLFADDMKILKHVENNHDSDKLQEDLLRFDNYCARNKLDLNIAKCHVITFSRGRSVSYVNYFIRGEILKRVSEIGDLGVIQDSKLIYDKHIDAMVTKAYKALGFVLRASSCFSNIKTIKILYCTYVRSILEYCSQVWNPQYDCYEARIERIQKRFINYLQFRTHVFDSDYEQSCRRFHLLPLSWRRDIADIAYFINIINGKVDCSDLLSKINFRVPTFSTRKISPFAIPLAKTNYQQNTFFYRTPANLNRLLQGCDFDIYANSTDSIKRRVAVIFLGSQDSQVQA